MKLSALVGVAIGCLVLVGCGGEEPGALVRGNVTYKGAPLGEGSITFYPNGSGQMSYGSMQQDGAFQLMNSHKTERIEPGSYVAVILAGNYQIAAAKEDPTYPVQPVVPLKFSSVSSSPLKFEIKMGENVLDVNLDKY